jgi:hypothetical protein
MVEFEGAFIHLIVRDDQRYDIFADDHDRRFYETDDQRLSGDECFVETIGKKNGYSVKLSDGIDATGGSPRSRRHHGVMMGIRRKKIAAVISPAIGRLKKIPSEP